MECFINGCSVCPMFKNEHAMCFHPSMEGRIEISNHIVNEVTPAWCPLRTEYLTIVLKQPEQ